MKIQLIDNWGECLKKSLAVLAAYLGAVFGALDLGYDQLMNILPILKDYIPDWQYAWVTFLVTVVIPLLRVVKQFKPPQVDLEVGQS